MADDVASLKRQLANVTRERDNLRMVAQRTATHCEALAKQLQEAKEEILTIGSKRTAAARAEKEKSPGHPNKSAIIQFDIDDSPTSLNSPGEAVSMDNLKAVQKKLARETEMKEQALAELKVARDLAAKAMLLVENVDTSSPGPTRAAAAGGGDSPSPGKGDQETSLVVKGWSQLCSAVLTKGADWLFTAKGAERQIDKIVGEYYEAPAQSRGASRQRNAERPSAKVTLDKIANIVDSRMKQLRRQEDELQKMMKTVQQWDTQSRQTLQV
eukprot:Tamp_19934.p1 GENE.Tamp_19934~~Tamp_19934.p1  ORF type:complete len:270 (+),score=79.72 Tamp_19934:71-880(+)